MRFQTENVMQSLEHMAHGLADLDRHARMLATATAEGNLVASISATEGSRRALGTIVAITVTLQQQVVSTDNLGKTLSSVGELVLRASQVVLLSQVNRLEEATQDLQARAEVPPHVSAWAQHLADAAEFVRSELIRINAIWTPHRRGVLYASPDGGGILHRITVRAAQYALEDLAHDPRLAKVLQEGAMRVEWPAISQTCQQIIAFLRIVKTIYVDVESEVLIGTTLQPQPGSEPRSQRPSVTREP